VLGIATGAVALAAAGFLFSLWISELSLFWIWELLSITAIAAVVGLTTLPELLQGGSSLKERILGKSTFGSLGLGSSLGIAVVSSAALAGAILAVGNTGGGDNSTVALRSALLFGVLLVACAFLDRQREGRSIDSTISASKTRPLAAASSRSVSPPSCGTDTPSPAPSGVPRSASLLRPDSTSQ